MAVSGLHRRSGVPTETLPGRKAETDRVFEGISEGFRLAKSRRVAPRGAEANGHATTTRIPNCAHFFTRPPRASSHPPAPSLPGRLPSTGTRPLPVASTFRVCAFCEQGRQAAPPSSRIDSSPSAGRCTRGGGRRRRRQCARQRARTCGLASRTSETPPARASRDASSPSPSPRASCAARS